MLFNLAYFEVMIRGGREASTSINTVCLYNGRTYTIGSGVAIGSILTHGTVTKKQAQNK